MPASKRKSVPKRLVLPDSGVTESDNTSEISPETHDNQPAENDNLEIEPTPAAADIVENVTAPATIKPKTEASESIKKLSTLHSKLINSSRVVSSLSKPAISRKVNAIDRAQANSSIYSGTQLSAPSLLAPKPLPPTGLGKGWFNMEPAELTEEMKRDIKIIELRNYLDPKRFYKTLKAIKPLHIGTVVEGPSEFRSSRLTNKERKQNIVDEILADKGIKDYAKKTYLKIQDEKSKKRKIFGKKRDKHSSKKSKKSFD